MMRSQRQKKKRMILGQPGNDMSWKKKYNTPEDGNHVRDGRHNVLEEEENLLKVRDVFNESHNVISRSDLV